MRLERIRFKFLNLYAVLQKDRKSIEFLFKHKG